MYFFFFGFSFFSILGAQLTINPHDLDRMVADSLKDYDDDNTEGLEDDDDDDLLVRECILKFTSFFLVNFIFYLYAQW